MNKTLTYGLIIGVIMVIWSIIQYSVAGMAGGLLWSLLGFLILAGLLFFFGTKLRGANGGVASFGKAFGWLMVMTIISSLVQYIFLIIYLTVINPDLVNTAQSAAAEVSSAMTENLGADQQAAADALASVGEGAMTGILITGFIFAFFIGLIVMAVVNLIIAAIIKKDPGTAGA